MNKAQAEKKYAFHAVFKVDVNGVKLFQNPTGMSPADHFLNPQSGNNKPMVESNFAFIDPVSTVYYG